MPDTDTAVTTPQPPAVATWDEPAEQWDEGGSWDGPATTDEE